MLCKVVPGSSLNIPTSHPQLLIDPSDRTGLQQFVSVLEHVSKTSCRVLVSRWNHFLRPLAALAQHQLLIYHVSSFNVLSLFVIPSAPSVSTPVYLSHPAHLYAPWMNPASDASHILWSYTPQIVRLALITVDTMKSLARVPFKYDFFVLASPSSLSRQEWQQGTRRAGCGNSYQWSCLKCSIGFCTLNSWHIRWLWGRVVEVGFLPGFKKSKLPNARRYGKCRSRSIFSPWFTWRSNPIRLRLD
jgi:hypothetical protein